MLPTILSRCQQVYAPSSQEIPDSEQASFQHFLSLDLIFLALKTLRDLYFPRLFAQRVAMCNLESGKAEINHSWVVI